MNDERARRVGLNEALFRRVNEEIESLNDAFGGQSTLSVICECGDGQCMERIEISLVDYERVARIRCCSSSSRAIRSRTSSRLWNEPMAGTSSANKTAERSRSPRGRTLGPDTLGGRWESRTGTTSRAGAPRRARWTPSGNRSGATRERRASASTAFASSPASSRPRPTRTARPRSRSSSSAGSGLAWQDGDVHEIRANDCVIYEADHFEHTFVAGPEGLEYVVFGTRHPTEVAWLPRSRAIRMGHPWVEGRDDNPWEVEANAPPLEYGQPAPRPANILNVDEVEHESWRDGDRTAPLATHGALEARRAALGEDRRRPPRRRAALPFRGGGGLRHPRRYGDARVWPRDGERRGDAAARGPRRRAAAGHAASRTPSAPARTA